MNKFFGCVDCLLLISQFKAKVIKVKLVNKL